MPRDADRVVGALLGALGRAHELEGLALEHALAVRRGAVAQMEARVGEDVRDAQPDAAGGDARRWREWTLERRLAVACGMAGRESIDDEIARRRSRMLEA